MSKTRFWWSVGAVWVVMAFTDWLFHGVWLTPLYQQTAQFWRPANEMQKMMPWLWFGQLVFSWAFVWIYSKGISKDNLWHQAFRYGFAILLVSKIPHQTVLWAMSPYPGELVLRWVFISAVQAFGAAIVMTWTYTPMKVWKSIRH